MINKIDIAVKGLLTALFALAAYIFYVRAYPCHVTYHEQYQMFLFASDYAAQVIGRPGGLAEYAARYLVQFFYVASWGAAILAVLLGALQLVTAWAMRARNLSMYAVSFAPAIVMWMALCDESTMVTALVALILAMLALLPLPSFKSFGAKSAYIAIMTAALYFVAGPFALAFTASAVLSEVIAHPRQSAMRYLVWALLLALGAMCPWIASWIWPYPIGRLTYGLSYFRYPFVVPAVAWWAAAAAVVAVAISPRLRVKSHWLVDSLAMAVVIGAGVWGIIDAANMDKEEVFAYDHMVRNRQWSDIVAKAMERHPDKPLSVAALNLALSKSGALPDHMFRFYQHSDEGLMPKFERDLTMPLMSAEIFYNLGMINSAQRFTYEAQEAIPDHQKSARCYKRLAETHIINGDYQAARKYLRTLQNTLLYDDWANQTMALLDDAQAIDNHPELGALRRLRYQTDLFFSEEEMDQMLGLLFVDNQDNKMAFEYLLALCLLKRDLDSFAKYYVLGKNLGYDHIPASYQEALALKWAMEHDNWQGLPYSLSPQVQQRMHQYILDRQQGLPLANKYAGTYWVYYFQDQ